MSERDEFETWYAEAKGQMRGWVTFNKCEAAWQAARAPRAVPALTDEQILDIGYAAKIVRSAGHWPLSERLVSIVDQQPSQEPQKAPQRYQD